MRVVFSVAVLSVLAAPPVIAQELAISQSLRSLNFTRNDTTHTITRTLPQTDRLQALRGAADPNCPPSCIQPMEIAPGVATVGELEVLDFMAGPVSDGTGLLVDARLQDWFDRGTLPGSISMPYPALSPDNSFLTDILQALGARRDAGVWRFDTAFDLLVFGNGISSDMAPRAIRGLLDAGFPASKLRWYRGGMIGWAEQGLSIEEPAG